MRPALPRRLAPARGWSAGRKRVNRSATKAPPGCVGSAPPAKYRPRQRGVRWNGLSSSICATNRASPGPHWRSDSTNSKTARRWLGVAWARKAVMRSACRRSAIGSNTSVTRPPLAALTTSSAANRCPSACEKASAGSVARTCAWPGKRSSPVTTKYTGIRTCRCSIASSTSRRRRVAVSRRASAGPSRACADTATTIPFNGSFSRSSASFISAWYQSPRSSRALASHATRGCISMAIIDLKNHQRQTSSAANAALSAAGNGETSAPARSNPSTLAAASPTNSIHGIRYSGVRPLSMSGERAIVRLASAMAAAIRATGSRSSSALPGPRSPIRLRVRPFSEALRCPAMNHHSTTSATTHRPSTCQKRIGSSGSSASARNTSPATTTSRTRVTTMRRNQGFFAVSAPCAYSEPIREKIEPMLENRRSTKSSGFMGRAPWRARRWRRLQPARALGRRRARPASSPGRTRARSA